MKLLRNVIILAAALALSGCIKDSDGEKVGSITRLSKDGWIPLCKTWEGEIIRGGMSNGTGILGGTPFHFTVSSDLADQVKQAMESTKEVKIHYHHEKFVVLGSCSSKSDGNFLDSIEIVH